MSTALTTHFARERKIGTPLFYELKGSILSEIF